MFALKPSPHTDAVADSDGTPDFPWQHGCACHEDRAMGLELELIELVHRRDAAVAHQEPTGSLDVEIDEVMSELATEAAIVGALLPAPEDGRS